MLYRTMLDNENMDMQGPQYTPNVNQDNPMMQQSQMEPQYMPSMDYPMMDEINSPPTYCSQTPQQQYQPAEDFPQYMSRQPYDNDSYQKGYQHGHHQGYQHGHHQGYQHGYYQGYHHHKNNYPYNDFYPFLFFPLFFGRD